MMEGRTERVADGERGEVDREIEEWRRVIYIYIYMFIYLFIY